MSPTAHPQMSVEKIIIWLNEAAYEAAPADQRVDWLIDQKNLCAALLHLGLAKDEASAKAMFSNPAPALALLTEATNNYEDVQLVIRGDAAAISPWNNSDVYIWRGYAEGGNLNLALILLCLCMKCYPLDLKRAWDDGHWFYINVEWQRAHHASDLVEVA